MQVGLTIIQDLLLESWESRWVSIREKMLSHYWSLISLRILRQIFFMIFSLSKEVGSGIKCD